MDLNEGGDEEKLPGADVDREMTVLLLEKSEETDEGKARLQGVEAASRNRLAIVLLV